jgi:uncharacterized repeat protein (TIGR01451 family)
MHKFYIFLLSTSFLLFSLSGFSQDKFTPLEQFRCGMPELTDNQQQELELATRKILSARGAARIVANSVSYVPIRVHIFRNAVGQGGIDLPKLNRVMAAANSYFLQNGYGILFYFAGTTPDYIDNDAYYAKFEVANENLWLAGRDAPDALNLYIVNNFDDPTLAGYANYPSDDLTSTRLFVRQGDFFTSENSFALNLTHELGHTFNLYHTFQGSIGSSPELVRRGPGANCSSAGDFVCDTPADPYPRLEGTTTNSGGCLRYTGSVTDPVGEVYDPSLSNIMSYYNHCEHEFTSGQLERALMGLSLRQSHTAYTLDYPSSLVAAPGNFLAELAADGKKVMLTWVDNATNELGYFIERSTRPNEGFVPIGGVGPNQVGFSDYPPTSATYYYRIRPSNTSTGSLSPVVPVTLPACRLSFKFDCNSLYSNGLSGVSLNGTVLSAGSGCIPSGYSSYATNATITAGQNLFIKTTPLNLVNSQFTEVWIDLNRNNRFDVDELLARSSYEAAPASLSMTMPLSLSVGNLTIRIQTRTTFSEGVCGNPDSGEVEDYRVTVITASACMAASSLTTTDLTGTSVRLAWVANSPSGYVVRYRTAGSDSWSPSLAVSSNSVSLTGLIEGQAYDWQVFSNCNDAGLSVAATSSFTTVCAVPSGLQTVAVYGNSAQVSWTDGLGQAYVLQWQPTGSPNWSTTGMIPTKVNSLSALSFATDYQWRVAHVCPSLMSAFTSPMPFTTTSELRYCQPITSKGCSYYDGLDGFVLGGFVMSSGSGCSINAYQYFPATNATLTPGGSYSFTTKYISPTFQEGLAIWADVDRNGSFEPNERLYTTKQLTSGSASGSIVIPASTQPGPLVIRARVVHLVDDIDPCVRLDFGETEDYLVNVSATPCISASITLSGSQSLVYGQSGTFTATITGTLPASLTLTNDLVIDGLSTPTYSFTALPSSIGKYAFVASRAANICGIGQASGAASLTVVPALCNTDPITGLYESNKFYHIITLGWNKAYHAASCTVRIREVGTTAWTEHWVGYFNQSLDYIFTSHPSGKVFEWQVKATCENGVSGQYSDRREFSMVCAPPIPGAVSTSQNSTSFRWETQHDGTIWLPVSLQWRQSGEPNWTTVSSLTASHYELTGLQANQTYEWRLASQCSTGGLGSYTNPLQFTTRCSEPTGITTALSLFNSIKIVWSGLSAADYKVRWRIVPKYPPGSDWVEGPIVSGTQYTIAGLASSNQYDVQVRMVCNNSTTDWSSPVRVVAQCGEPVVIWDTPRARSATLTWRSVPDASYEVQWRSYPETSWSSLTCTPGLNGVTDDGQIVAAIISGLTENTYYTYRVRTLCSADVNSGFNYQYGFTTLETTDLSMKLTVNKRVPVINEVITFTGQLLNESQQTATGVLALCRLPPNMVFVSSGLANVVSSGSSVSIAIGTVASGSQIPFSFQAKVTQPGSYQVASQLIAGSPEDTDSYVDSGTADGEDDATTIDLRTSEPGDAMSSSPNPTQRTLPEVITNQPAPDPTEADLSLALQVSNRVALAGTTINLAVKVMNRGSLTATNIAVQVTLPNGWQVLNPAGLFVQGQVVTVPIGSLVVGEPNLTHLTVRVQGENEQLIQAVIAACDQPDHNSPHSNQYGVGEDDEASVSVRVR